MQQCAVLVAKCRNRHDMAKPCRLSFFAYMANESHKADGHYDDHDLINGIDYCKYCLELGLSVEPMDGFSLQGFISWAEREIQSK